MSRLFDWLLWLLYDIGTAWEIFCNERSKKRD
jgi:hypothetical protein